MILENCKVTVTRADGTRFSGLVTSDYYQELLDLLLKAMPQRDADAEQVWRQLIENTKGILQDAMSDFEGTWLEGDTFCVQWRHRASARFCDRPNNHEAIRDALSDIYGREMQLRIIERTTDSFDSISTLQVAR